MKYYIDLGSSTTKVYKYEDTLALCEEKSIYFKNGFTKEEGIAKEQLKQLFEYFAEIKEKYAMTISNTNIFATGIFRNIPLTQRDELIKRFYDEVGLYLNIISHGIENYYLGKAMDLDYAGKSVMVLNMGGKTTELVFFKDNKIVDRINLKAGVADMLNQFPESYANECTVDAEEMLRFAKEKIGIPEKTYDCVCGIFTGGELRFEQLTHYELEENDLFDDGVHRFKTSLTQFKKDNLKILYDYSMQDLYDLMPQNPKWMDGAKAGAIFGQAVFELFGIDTIIPSDLNLINGVVNDEK